MRGRLASLRASHHQAEVSGFDMFPAHLEAMRHRGA